MIGSPVIRMPIGYDQEDRIQTPKALCNRPVSDITKKIKSNSKCQKRFAYRPRLRSLNLSGVQRATARDTRRETIDPPLATSSALPPSPRGVTHFGAGERARPAPPASSLARASSRASLCIDLSMCVSRDALSDERRHRSLRSQIDLSR